MNDGKLGDFNAKVDRLAADARNVATGAVAALPIPFVGAIVGGGLGCLRSVTKNS